MTNEPTYQKGAKVVSRDGKETGTLTGGQRRCQMAGCTGVRVGVRWADNKVTFPCTKSLEPREGALHLL